MCRRDGEKLFFLLFKSCRSARHSQDHTSACKCCMYIATDRKDSDSMVARFIHLFFCCGGGVLQSVFCLLSVCLLLGRVCCWWGLCGFCSCCGCNFLEELLSWTDTRPVRDKYYSNNLVWSYKPCVLYPCCMHAAPLSLTHGRIDNGH